MGRARLATKTSSTAPVLIIAASPPPTIVILAERSSPEWAETARGLGRAVARSPAPGAGNGTTITLSHLDQALNFPSEDKLRTLLLYEYGREGSIKIHVNGKQLDVEDLPGETERMSVKLPNAGDVKLRFTIAQGKLPKHPGFLLRAGGKVVGRPEWFGLDENTDIPEMPAQARLR